MQSKFFIIFIFYLLSSHKIICQGQTCIRDSFHVHCKNGIAILTFRDPSNSRTFVVQRVDYLAQEITFLGPSTCFAQNLESLDQNYKLYKCRGDRNFVNQDFHMVQCLSTSNYTVVATPLNDSILSCDEFGEMFVPANYQQGKRLTFMLTWSDGCTPQVGCPVAGGPSSPIYSKKVFIPIALAIAVGPLAFACLACCIAKIVIRRRNSSRAATGVIATTTTTYGQHHPETGSTLAGLDQSSIDSYPIVVIGEDNGHLLKNGQDSICPICLCDYCPNESLKILPECLHRFHADCIDQWLRAKALCPICRAAPPTSIRTSPRV